MWFLHRVTCIRRIASIELLSRLFDQFLEFQSVPILIFVSKSYYIKFFKYKSRKVSKINIFS